MTTRESSSSERRSRRALPRAQGTLAAAALFQFGQAERRILRQAEREATDERNFVKKGVSWALRLIGRRNAALHAKTLACAKRLASSQDATARWIGKDAVRELTGPVVMRKLGQQRGSKR